MNKTSSFLHMWKISNVSKKALIIPLLITVISSILSLITSLLVMQIMDNLEDYIDYDLIVIGIILLVVSTILSAVSSFLLSRVAERIVLNIRKKLWAKALDLPLSFYQKKRSGEIVSRLTNDTTGIVDITYSFRFL
ncbi:ABC transporter transmembrane domain-containing protein [Bacillus solimangrovi]|uniref:ABC transmembrane type-1 domain-containing protein n=1 Tax=Bacillus solimangrovi TaxID=1305675 RepID=A0A1E5LDA0_9BACI|nr:ABC transporter transmembrane domain-containing protein [Bacillus solimangrovi]OEH92053.1 hypothetical protein BFG57_16900 [Bacillus solimangrovi]